MALRVLHVVGGYPTPANPHNLMFVKTQVDSLAGAGVESDVLVLQGRSLAKYATGWAQVHRRLRGRQYDLIHGHYAYCAAVCLGHGLPVVTSLLGSDLVGFPRADGSYSSLSRAIHGKLARFVVRRSGAGIVKSEQMKQVLGLDVHVVPNGVDCDRFQPLDPASRAVVRSELDLAEGTRYVLFAGNPAWPRKRFPLAQSGVAAAAGRLPFLVELVPVSGRSHEDVLRYMQACDMLLLTSSWEGSPNVVKEAMAANMAVVAVDVGDVRERLTGVAGCRVAAADDAESVADAIVDVLTSGEAVASRAAVAPLRSETIAARIVSIYGEALRRRGPQSRPARGDAPR
jgi:teichuronic acid biosynthesis glycosyltransferase TuaC